VPYVEQEVQPFREHPVLILIFHKYIVQLLSTIVVVIVLFQHNRYDSNFDKHRGHWTAMHK